MRYNNVADYAVSAVNGIVKQAINDTPESGVGVTFAGPEEWDPTVLKARGGSIRVGAGAGRGLTFITVYIDTLKQRRKFLDFVDSLNIEYSYEGWRGFFFKTYDAGEIYVVVTAFLEALK